MFGKKRVVTLRVEKKSKQPENESTTTDENELGEKLLKLLPKVMIGGVLAVYGYVILNAVCDITVEQNK